MSGYQAAQEGAAIWAVPDPGYLIVRGEHQQDFVQRQTTNDVRQLAPGRTQPTVLTSPTARILDVWRLVPEAEGIGIVTLPGRGAHTARYLQSRIFFMDKVTVTDASAEVAQVEVIGPNAATLLGEIGVPAPPDQDALLEAPFEGGALRAIGLDAAGGHFLLLVPSAGQDALLARLSDAGAAALDEAAYEALRIEAGLPGPARELTEDFTPLEANLDAAISLAKGCYTGQEILARQVNYDKITRRLVGLRLASAAAPGAAVQVDGRTAGEVTSVVESPRYGWVALAVVKRPHHAPGTEVMVQDEVRTVAATVAALPFDAS